ncbi:hypothetical protein J5N97_008469 [Dioscorea zingiberensis]|uniref:Uncharacterized protein n=1 Tax=Dioscorea zingiberensis TaxID=325984 RepID=A0A9D5CW76_9LILI|nr:hypothetical protein J5N97_008469 [Dioscorea zingiberensis]
MEGSRLELGNPIGDAISRVQFAPKSNNLLISSWDSFLRLYDVDGSSLRVQALSEGALLDCCFQDESLSLSASSDGCIRRYDLYSGAQSIIGKHDNAATCVEYSDGTGQFLDQSKSSAMGCVFRYHPKLKERKNHLVAVNDMAFHPRFDTFVTGDNEGYAIIWDAQSRKKLYEFQRYSNSVACLSYNHIGQLLAVASGHTYQEANEVEEAPQIFLHKTENLGRLKSTE